jgi:hypothetical protein
MESDCRISRKFQVTLILQTRSAKRSVAFGAIARFVTDDLQAGSTGPCHCSCFIGEQGAAERILVGKLRMPCRQCFACTTSNLVPLGLRAYLTRRGHCGEYNHGHATMWVRRFAEYFWCSGLNPFWNVDPIIPSSQPPRHMDDCLAAICRQHARGGSMKLYEVFV